ncbi:MAG: protein kinase [Candidatus Acidiferrales bacterium]
MIGKQIGSYRILEKLGEGGMGVVYKAVDMDLDRTVAMKVLSADLSNNPELVGRFRAEAKAQANLNHTNLATLYAFLIQDGTAFMVMEFIEGENFGQMIARRGPIPESEAIPLFRQALLGIGFAHRAGIVHRDIKPSNMMLNKNGIVKVMDFGIAKVMGTRGMTRTGTQMGTVAYMSPEQIQNRPVDIRSDIYELGVTLYEMLSGRVPFESDSDFQIMQDHVRTPPPLPSKFFPYISKGVENVVLKSLEKDPDSRFQSVEQFGAALEHPESVVFAPAPTPGEAVTVGLRGTVLQPTAPVSPAVPLASPVAQPTQPATQPGTPAAAQRRAIQPAAPARSQQKWLIGGAGVVLAVLIAIAVYKSMAPAPPPVGPTAPSSGGGSSHTSILPATPSQPSPSLPVDTFPPTSDSPGTAEPAPTAPSSRQPAPSSTQPSSRTRPATISADQMFQNAQNALRQHHYFEPINNSALYWAIQARKAGNAGGKALEDQILQIYREQMNEYYRQGNYRAALGLVNGMLRFYPGDTNLLSERNRIQSSLASSSTRK